MIWQLQAAVAFAAFAGRRGFVSARRSGDLEGGGGLQVRLRGGNDQFAATDGYSGFAVEGEEVAQATPALSPAEAEEAEEEAPDLGGDPSSQALDAPLAAEVAPPLGSPAGLTFSAFGARNESSEVAGPPAPALAVPPAPADKVEEASADVEGELGAAEAAAEAPAADSTEVTEAASEAAPEAAAVAEDEEEASADAAEDAAPPAAAPAKDESAEAVADAASNAEDMLGDAAVAASDPAAEIEKAKDEQKAAEEERAEADKRLEQEREQVQIKIAEEEAKTAGPPAPAEEPTTAEPTTTTTTMQAAPKHDVEITFVVESIDYTTLAANPIYTERFEHKIKRAMAVLCGSKYETDAVKVELSAGSVGVKAIVTPRGSDTAEQVVADLSDADKVSKEVAARLTSMEDIEELRSGKIVVDDVSEPKTITAVPAAPVTAAPSTNPMFADDTPDVCSPACMAGRGICNDKVCFCKTPFMGVQCEKRLETGLMRFSYTVVVAFAVISFVIGIASANLLFTATASTYRQFESMGTSQVRKETWKPSEAPKK